MATVVFSSYYMSGTNQDKKRGGVVTAYFSQISGSLPPAGSTLRKVTVYFSNINVYSTVAAGFSTPYGSMSLALDCSGAQTRTMSAYSSILDFTGGSIAFTVTGGGSSTSGVLNVREGSYIEITIEYVPSSTSTATLSSTTVQQGGQLGVSVNAASSDFTHSVVFSRSSSYSTTVNLAAGTTDTEITIPTSWPTGSATCTLITYFDGVEIGRVSYTFTITINPGSSIPSAGVLSVALVQSAYIPSAWGVYVKGYSIARLSLSGVSPGTDASYKSIAMYCGSQSQATASRTSFTTTPLLETGAVSCRAEVTNSFGNKATATPVNIQVYDYFSPTFLSVVAFRCTANGTPSDHGAYIAVTVRVTIADVNGKNSLAALQAQYCVAGSGSWSTAANITNGVQAIIGGNLTSDSSYQVRITAIDQVQNLQGTYSATTVTALTSEHVIFCKNGGLNVSFGMEGTRNNAVEINPDWGLYHGDTNLAGTVGIERGGTGATDKATALSNIGAAAAKHSHSTDDINSGVLSIVRGGTGASTAAAARSALGITPANIGAAASDHDHALADMTGTLGASQLPYKFAAGMATINGDSSITIYYSGFTSVPYIVACYCSSSGNWSGDNGAIKIHSRTTTSAQIVVGGNWSSDREICWFAFGT